MGVQHVDEVWQSPMKLRANLKGWLGGGDAAEGVRRARGGGAGRQAAWLHHESEFTREPLEGEERERTKGETQVEEEKERTERARERITMAGDEEGRAAHIDTGGDTGESSRGRPRRR